MTIQEDRIHDETREGATAFLASEMGVVVVDLAGAQVGRFRVDRRGVARDVAADGVVAVATDEDVLVRDPGRSTGEDADGTAADGDADEGGDADASEGGTSDGPDGDPYRPTGFGAAVAVGVDGDALVAADPDGGIHRRVDDEWLELARIDHEVRAVDGTLVAAGDGIYRATPDGLDHVGLTDGRDVAACGPYAATGDGLYELGNGWMTALEGAFDVVDCSRDRDRSHAGAGTDLFARRDGEWIPAEAPADARIVGIDYAHGDDECTYAVTVEGTILAREPGDAVGAESWRTRNVGVRGVEALAIP